MNYPCVNGPVNTSKTSVFLVLTEPENYRIMERILKFTGQKTTGKEWILRPENARELWQNAAFSKINRGFSETVNTIFLAVGGVVYVESSPKVHKPLFSVGKL